jgi:hypothetical protein
VRDLERDATLMTDPVLRMEWPWLWSPYTTFYAELFTTRDNFSTLPPPPFVDPGPLEIELPAHARILFPARFAGPAQEFYGPPTYTHLKLVVPQGHVGPLRVPLILQALRGSGQVVFEGQSFEVGSPELDAQIALRVNAGHDVEVLEARSDLELVFLMNQVRWQLRPQNALAFDVLSGSQSWVGSALLGAAGADSDADGIADDGDASGVAGDRPCAHAELAGCDDNCTFLANPSQSDADADRAGDACDGDLTGDGFVDVLDVSRLIECQAAWHDAGGGPLPPGCAAADIDGNGILGPGDQTRLTDLYGREPSPHEQIDEGKGGCGLGFELVALALLRRRRRA